MPSSKWTAEQVAQWVSSLGFPQYSQAFIDNNIAGDILSHLDHNDMGDIGISKIGHRVLILKSIYQLKQSEGGDDHGKDSASGYIPPSVRSVTDVDDYNRLVRSFEIRDQRVQHMEYELKKLMESFNKIREDLLPLFRWVKESKPLPTPDGANPIHSSSHYMHSPGTPSDPPPHPPHPPPPLPTSSKEAPTSTVSVTPAPSIVRKLSKLTHKSTPQKSPTSQEPDLTSSASASATNLAMLDKRPNILLSPATPVLTPGGSTTLHFSQHPYQGGSAASSQVNMSNSSLASPSQVANPEPFKSFRVTLDDPCYKVLPAALRRYKINGDWKQYALLVCYGDQERLLGLEEKPLIIFKELQDAGKQPVFMLRHIEGMKQSGVVVGTPGGVL